MSQVSVSQAAKLTGKSRETINKATQSGKLACTRDSANKKVIEIAELERVYPLVATIDEISKPSAPVSKTASASEPDRQAETVALRERLKSSEQAYQTLTAERERERRQFESEVENLRDSLQKAQEQHGKALLLITDQSAQDRGKQDDWDKSLRSLETRLANQEKQQQELKVEAKRRITRLRQELEAERSKSFFAKLFGRSGQG